MESGWTVRAEGVSKKFALTLRQSMLYGVKDSLRALVGLHVPTDVLRPGEFWGVKDVSFELRQGECLGVMGVNGAGKTTLLRVLNGVFAPDAGKVSLRGRVGALIAAGAGFAPMLTGRENVYVNGALLGMSRREIDAKMDEIIAFADLRQFIDTAVKHYSSGMFVRLGFAIAAMSEPEILLIDEVLAVGDLNFQKKCYDYLHRLKRNGTTIILVSHSVGAIWAISDRGIFMHEGEVRVIGTVEDVIRAYADQSAAAGLVSLSTAPAQGVLRGGDSDPLPAAYGGRRGGTGEVTCQSVRMRSLRNNRSEGPFEFGESLAIEAVIEVKAPIEAPLFRFAIDAVHYKFIACLDSFEQELQMEKIGAGIYHLRVEVPEQNLMPGAYTINMAVCCKRFGAHLFFWFGACTFQIMQPRDRFFYSEDKAVMYLDARFTLMDSAGHEIATSGPTSPKVLNE